MSPEHPGTIGKHGANSDSSMPFVLKMCEVVAKTGTGIRHIAALQREVGLCLIHVDSSHCCEMICGCAWL